MRNSDVTESFADAKYRLQIHIDDFPSSPRKDDEPLNTIVAWHRRYALSDTDEFDTPEDFLLEMKRSKQQFYPLYLMDHTILTLQTEPFGGIYGQWDSGQVGWVYAPHDRIRDYLGVKRITKAVRERVEKMIDTDLEVYSAYLNGWVYGYTIEARDPEYPPCPEEAAECDEPDPDDAYTDEVDACWGFFGTGRMKEFMKENVEPDLQYLFDRL
jgi:hypothetical protein